MRRTKKRHAPPAPAAAAPAPGAEQNRRARWGGAAIAVWYLGGFALLLVGALWQVGPFAWAAAWQVRHFGGDTVLLSFLPGFAVLAAPVVALQLLPRRPDRPFLTGAQDALSTRGRDGGRGDGVAGTVPPDRLARILRRLARVGFALSGLCLVAGWAGYALIIHIGDRGAGAPLPTLSLAEATADPSPDFATLIGVVPHPEAGWLHNHAIRQTQYHDLYIPLTEPDWKPGDPVRLLEKQDADAPTDPAGPGAPIEGALKRGAFPGWMVTELRRRGTSIVDDPTVFEPRVLHGKTPGADRIGAWLSAWFGSLFALILFAISLAWLHRRRRLLGRDAPR